MADDPVPATQLDYYYALRLLRYSLMQIEQKQREAVESDITGQRMIARQYIAQLEGMQPALDTTNNPLLAQLSMESLKKQAPTLFDLVEPVGIQPSLSPLERKYSMLNEMHVVRAVVGAVAREMQASHGRMNHMPHSSAIFDAVLAQLQRLHGQNIMEAHREAHTPRSLMG